MRLLHRLYVAICRRWGPQGMTFSAYAHKLAMQGRPFWRNRVDGLFLLLFGMHQHCQSSHQQETSSLTDA